MIVKLKIVCFGLTILDKEGEQNETKYNCFYYS